MKPLGDTFINLVRMVIAPIVFVTVVLGIASMQDIKKVGRVGGKAFLYFEVVTTFALAIGLVVMNVTRPGAGIDATALAGADVSRYTSAGRELSFVDFVTHIVPTSVVGAFAEGEILQVVFFSVLFGVALSAMGPAGRPIVDGLDRLAQVFFRIVAIVMAVAPIGAFGAMAYTIGTFGVRSLLPLAGLMANVYLTMALFIFVVLNGIARYYRFSLWAFLGYIREEILIVLGTSSSEAALPRMLDKMERYGCAKPVVGLVIPAATRSTWTGPPSTSRWRPSSSRRPTGSTSRSASSSRARGADGHQQGRGGRDRLRVHRARLHPRRPPRRSRRGGRAPARRRPVHERGALDHEPDRERRRHARHLAERERLRRCPARDRGSGAAQRAGGRPRELSGRRERPGAGSPGGRSRACGTGHAAGSAAYTCSSAPTSPGRCRPRGAHPDQPRP
jgi:hypothetical protein